MSPKEIYELIQKEGLHRVPKTVINELFQMDQASYDKLVVYLLSDDGQYARSQEDGFLDYKCQIDGSVFFTMRPNPDIYQHVLNNSVKIWDPSSCCEAVIALLQVKSPPDVARDRLNLIDKHAPNDLLCSRIIGMFYWLGTSPKALMKNSAWPGIATSYSYAHWFDKRGLRRGQKDPETGHPLTPPTDAQHAEEVAILILEKMLDLFEANNANQTARGIIAQLPIPDKGYLQPYRDRIIRAFISANSSSDDYVRHRVSGPIHQRFIHPD